MSKVPVKQVILTWSEAQGLPGIGEFPKEFGSFREANAMLWQIAETDRMFRRENGTYLGGTLKTGIRILWEDGTELDKSRIDVGYFEGKPTGVDIVEHIRMRAQWTLKMNPPRGGETPWAKKYRERFEEARCRSWLSVGCRCCRASTALSGLLRGSVR